MEIRSATANDHSGAAAVQHAVLEGSHPYEYADNIMCSGIMNLVAVRGSNVVGFISILFDGYNPNGTYLWQRLRPYLAFVGVLPDQQHQHIGAALVQHGAALILPKLARGIWVECPESAAGFYQKLGFVRATREDVHQATGMAPSGPVYLLNQPVALAATANSSLQLTPLTGRA